MQTCFWGELSWGELSLGRVVLIPSWGGPTHPRILQNILEAPDKLGRKVNQREVAVLEK